MGLTLPCAKPASSPPARRAHAAAKACPVQPAGGQLEARRRTAAVGLEAAAPLSDSSALAVHDARKVVAAVRRTLRTWWTNEETVLRSPT
jgi:hypothetical protein